MHPMMLNAIVERCRQRQAQGDCPDEPAFSTEQLEDAVIELAAGRFDDAELDAGVLHPEAPIETQRAARERLAAPAPRRPAAPEPAPAKFTQADADALAEVMDDLAVPDCMPGGVHQPYCRDAGKPVSKSPASAQGTTEERLANPESGLSAKLLFDRAHVDALEALGKRVAALEGEVKDHWVAIRTQMSPVDLSVVEMGQHHRDCAFLHGDACNGGCVNSKPAAPPQPAPVGQIAENAPRCCDTGEVTVTEEHLKLAAEFDNAFQLYGERHALLQSLAKKLAKFEAAAERRGADAQQTRVIEWCNFMMLKYELNKHAQEWIPLFAQVVLGKDDDE